MDRFYTIAAISIFYVISIYVQKNILSFLYVTTNTALFYVPAAIAMMATLITPRYSAIAIFIGGTFATYFFSPSNDILTAAVKASLPALGCTLTALLITSFHSRLKTITMPKSTLSEITAFDVMLTSIIYALVTNLLFRIYFVHYVGEVQSYDLFALRIFADFTGSFLVFIGLNISYIIYKNVRNALINGPLQRS